MKFAVVTVVFLLIVLSWACVGGLPAKMCKTCNQKHAPPRGNCCQRVVPPEPVLEQPPVIYPSCRTCSRRHAPPRGRNCDQLFLDDGLHDPFAGRISPPVRSPSVESTQGSGETTHVLLHRLSSQIGEMNANVVNMQFRVSALETAAHRSPVASRREPPMADRGIRARMQALGLQQNDTGSQDDDWEVAGAGAPPPQGKKPLKSGAFIQAQHDVLVQFDFPHKHVLRGAGRPAPLALNLTQAEFVYGYQEMMDDPHLEPVVRTHMSSFLKILMEDVNLRPWAQVRHFHMTVIQSMEAGQLQWGETDKILAIQRQHVRGSMTGQSFTPAPRRIPTARPVPVPAGAPMLYCAAFQSNSCEKPTDHDSPRGYLQHICAYCLRITGKAFSSHGEADCRRKKLAEEAKNAQ